MFNSKKHEKDILESFLSHIKSDDNHIKYSLCKSCGVFCGLFEVNSLEVSYAHERWYLSFLLLDSISQKFVPSILLLFATICLAWFLV